MALTVEIAGNVMSNEDYTDVVWDGDKYLEGGDLTFTRTGEFDFWFHLFFGFTVLKDDDVSNLEKDYTQEDIDAFNELIQIGAVETGKRGEDNFYRLSSKFLAALTQYNKNHPIKNDLAPGPF